MVGDNQPRQNRRRVLKSIGAAGAFSLALPTGSVAAASEDEEEPVIGEASGSLKLTPKNAMSNREFGRYVSETVRSESPERARLLLPPHIEVREQEDSDDGMSIQTVSTENFSHEDTWDSEIQEVHKDGDLMGKTRHMATLYEGDYTDPDGHNVYALWHNSRTDISDVTRYNTKTDKMDNEIDLPSHHNLHSYEPVDTVTEDGMPVDLGLGYYGMSIGTTLHAGGGTVSTSLETSTGWGSEYQLRFRGCSKGDDGMLIMNGLSLIVTDDTYISKWETDWDWYTRFNSSLNCFYG